MHGEYPSPHEQSSEQEVGNLVEVKDNVIPMHREKPAEHAIQHIMGEVGTHKRSLYLLSELGSSNLEHANQKLEELRKERDEILKDLNKYLMLSALGKLKDKVFNQGKKVSQVTELGSKIHKLESAVRFTKATEHLAESEAAQENADVSQRAA